MPYHGSSWSNARLAFHTDGNLKSLPTKLTFCCEEPGVVGTFWFRPSGLKATGGTAVALNS